MRSRVEPVHKPRPGSDRGADSERAVLRELERLEVIEDNRLAEASAQIIQRSRVEQHGVSPEMRADARNGIRRTVE